MGEEDMDQLGEIRGKIMRKDMEKNEENALKYEKSRENRPKCKEGREKMKNKNRSTPAVPSLIRCIVEGKHECIPLLS